MADLHPIPASEIAAKLGGRPALARVCGVDKSTPYSWTLIPPVHVPAVAEATGLDRHMIRPDLPALFPHPAEAAA